jgi:putative transcriptional regulator
MRTKLRNPNRLTKELLETADDMRRAGVIDPAPHEKITLRHLGRGPDARIQPITGNKIRFASRARASEPGCIRPASQQDDQLCFAAGAR